MLVMALKGIVISDYSTCRSSVLNKNVQLEFQLLTTPASRELLFPLLNVEARVDEQDSS